MPLAASTAAFLLLWLYERRRARRCRIQALEQALQHAQQQVPLSAQPQTQPFAPHGPPLIVLQQHDDGATSDSPDTETKRHSLAELSTM